MKITTLIGQTLFDMESYFDAISCFETVISFCTEIEILFNLIVCYYITDNKLLMKSTFRRLVSATISKQDDIENDKLVRKASCLITPVVENTLAEGKVWVADAIKTSELKYKESSAMDSILSSSNSDDEDLTGGEGKSIFPSVSKGNEYYLKGDLINARAIYEKIYTVNSDRPEVIYNLALVSNKMGLYEISSTWLTKLNSLGMITSAETMFLFAVKYYYFISHENVNELDSALYWYRQLLVVAPSDPTVLCKVGNLLETRGDNVPALEYYREVSFL